jgi:DNA invertase Pin-like site-specific DNA recombinase
MTTAAVYARKSTRQDGVDDDQRSVERQVDNARDFAAKNGWRVDDRHVYVDDGVSGAARLTRLQAKARLLEVIKRRPPFSVLIVQAPDRLSRRDGDEALAEMKTIAQAGIEIWFYSDGTRFEYGTLATNVTAFMKSEVAADFRRMIAAKTYEAMLAKAKAGLVTGGRVFGYDNERISKGKARHQINQAEAAVVKRIFEHYAAGKGLRGIAHLLNDQGALSPRAQQGRPSGWDPGTIRAVLHRSIYRGRLEYNRTKKRDRSGDQKISKRHPDELIVVEAPHLRIISEDLEFQVGAMLGKRRGAFLRAQKGQLIGQAAHGRYLLSGLLRCPCGAKFEAQKNPHGNRQGSVYCCAAARRKGKSVCANRLALPIGETEERILNVIDGEVLTSAFIELVLDTVFVPDDTDRPALESEAAQMQTEISRLIALARSVGDIPEVAAELKTANLRLREVQRRLAPQEHHNREELRAALEQRVADWRRVLRTNPAQGRQVLRHLVGEILLWGGDAGDLATYDGAKPGDHRGTENITAADCGWMASAQIEGLLVGLPGFGSLVQRVASPAGSSTAGPVVQRMASPICASWNQLSQWLRAVDGLRRAA